MELPSHVLAAISLQYNKEMFVRTHILSLFDISWHSNEKGANRTFLILVLMDRVKPGREACKLKLN
jgi:hypothetical protein